MSISVPLRGELGAPMHNFDVMRVAKAKVGSPGSTDVDVVLDGTAAATAIFSVAAGTLVHEVVARVATAYTASAALSLGDSDDVDGWAHAVLLGCTVVSTNLVSSKGAMIGSTALPSDPTLYAPGKYYAAAQTIDVTAGATFAVGQMDVYMLYSRF